MSYRQPPRKKTEQPRHNGGEKPIKQICLLVALTRNLRIFVSMARPKSTTEGHAALGEQCLIRIEIAVIQFVMRALCGKLCRACVFAAAPASDFCVLAPLCERAHPGLKWDKRRLL